jgi:MFS transporter, SP family, arabinose:H+ symporter
VLAITQFTPILLKEIGGAFTFWVFMVNAIILLVFTWFKIPETNQRTLEEIEKSWKA